MTQQIAFVSGHLDLTAQEFITHYGPALDRAMADGDKIVVGDARGADTMSIMYLSECGYTDVTVYHMFTAPRINCSVYEHGLYKTCGGFVSDKDRDTAMTVNSTYDIAWIRPGREKSGTAKNLKRRAEFQAHRC